MHLDEDTRARARDVRADRGAGGEKSAGGWTTSMPGEDDERKRTEIRDLHREEREWSGGRDVLDATSSSAGLGLFEPLLTTNRIPSSALTTPLSLFSLSHHAPSSEGRSLRLEPCSDAALLAVVHALTPCLGLSPHPLSPPLRTRSTSL